MDLSKKAAPRRQREQMSPVTGMPVDPVTMSAGKSYNGVARAHETLAKAAKDGELVIVRDEIIRKLFGEAEAALRGLAQALFDAARDADIPSKGV